MSRLIDKQILFELKRMNKNGGGSGSGDDSDTPSSSAMVIEMEWDELSSGSLHPKTIPSEFVDENEYWEYVRQFIIGGGMVVFKYYADGHLEAPEDALLTDLAVTTIADEGESSFRGSISTCYGTAWERPE